MKWSALTQVICLMYSTKMLAGSLNADANSFNLMRLLAALCVLFSHSFVVVLGRDAVEPLMTTTPYSLGQHAVNVFFVLSGLMLAQSLDRDPNLVRFVKARILRIFPGLFAYGFVFALVMGPFLTNLTFVEYVSDIHTFVYPFDVMLHFQNATPPHGIFAGAPAGSVVNLPLWTIRYELAAYIGLVAIFALGFLRKASGAILVLASVLALFLLATMFIPRPAGDTFVHHLLRYGLCFMIGVAAYHLSSRIPVSAWLLPLTALSAWLMRDTLLEEPAFLLLAAHLVLVGGSRSYGALTRWTRRTDISYGTYIYGWPVQQSLEVFFPGLGVAGLTVTAVLIVPLLGLASWRYVEEPALRLKRVSAVELVARKWHA